MTAMVLISVDQASGLPIAFLKILRAFGSWPLAKPAYAI
jgi:hypothetical protein